MVLEIWFQKSSSRNRVREKWFYKLGFFSGSRKVVDQKKKSKFAEPLFYTFLEKWLQIKWLTVIMQGQASGSTSLDYGMVVDYLVVDVESVVV